MYLFIYFLKNVFAKELIFARFFFGYLKIGSTGKIDVVYEDDVFINFFIIYAH